MTEPLTPKQQALLAQYHQARIDWERGCGSADSLAVAYAAAIDDCLAYGLDPFHHPNPLPQ